MAKKDIKAIVKKKGIDTRYIIAGVIIVVVAVLVIFGLSSNIFNLGFTGGSSATPSTVRYSISDNTVQYYDGKTWMELSITDNAPIPRGDKEVVGQEVFDDLWKYYYTWQVNLYSPIYRELYAQQNMRRLTLSSATPPIKIQSLSKDPNTELKFGRGYISFSLLSGGLYHLAADNTLYQWNYATSKVEPATASNAEQIKDVILHWRDDVLKIPVRIRYRDAAGTLHDDSYFCASKEGNTLVADLSKPVSSSYACSG
ncbi:hypothetical protein KW805_02700 [Candidatus Pacearchaeota archaeon]|nr:hypothetical protein [Candidatus Pacearchaeota archaeon]